MLVDGKATIRFTVDGDAPENSNCGAFTRKPRTSDMQAPEKRIECPAGLTYFEKGATYGCSL